MRNNCVNVSKFGQNSKKRQTPPGWSFSCVLAVLVLLSIIISCQNINVDTSIVDPCTFDHDTGKYSAPFSLVISNNTADEIWYTDDGISEPQKNGATSKKYTAPITIEKTTIIKAKGFKENLRPSEERSATFTFVWTRGKDMEGISNLLGRYDFACTAVASYIYVIAGREMVVGSSASMVKSILIYNINNKTWSVAANTISADRQGMDVALYNGKIYLVGGASASGAVGITEEYNPDNGTWTSKGNLNIPRYGHRLAVIGNFIYAIGGENSGGLVKTVEKFDPSNGLWTSLDSEFDSGQRTMFGIGVIDNKAYVFGGFDGLGNRLKTCQVFDPSATPKWQNKTEMPVSSANIGSCVFDGRIYAIAGEQVGGIVSNNYCFDPLIDNGSWSSVWPIPVGRKNFGVVVVNGHIYCISGLIDSTEATNSVYIYDPLVDD